MNCKEVQRQLVPYINGELQEKAEEEFVRHVRHCPDCYEELEVYATVFAGIRQLDGAEEKIDYRTLVEDTLENSEEDAKDGKDCADRWTQYYQPGVLRDPGSYE